MNDEPERRSIAVWAVPAAIVLLMAGMGYWYWSRPGAKPVAVAATPVSSKSAPETTTAPPAIAHPIDATESTNPNPLSLENSDAPIAAELAGVAGPAPIADWLIPETVIRRFVATVDNLPRTKIAERMRPLRSLHGPFAVHREPGSAPGEERLTLSDDNFARYDAAVSLLAKVDMHAVAGVYKAHYGLFQQAYEELGYPGRYFNDRLVEAIDHLLQAPELAPGVALVQPKVMFEYADAALENRSAGQKILMRMGPKHAATVKLQLANLRLAIVNPQSATSGR
jgi:Protein of unknown function (DUF3014)